MSILINIQLTVTSSHPPMNLNFASELNWQSQQEANEHLFYISLGSLKANVGRFYFLI